MIPIASSLEGKEQEYGKIHDALLQYDFVLGGNWDYEHGSFDKHLDEGRKVWLRIPFQVTRGQFDGELNQTNAHIRLGQPYVLRHVYNEGLDDKAQVRVTGALIDQFQEPLDRDGEVGAEWVGKAETALREAERVLA